MVARIAAPRLLGRWSREPLATGCEHRGGGDIQLRPLRAAREVLDRAAVERARRKIHFLEAAIGGKDGVDEAESLEQLLPIDFGDQTQAGDDVADGDVRGALSTMDVAHDRLGRRVLDRQTLIEPCQRRRDPRILVAQPMHELNGERFGKRRALMGEKDDGDRFGGPFPGSEQPVGQAVRHITRRATLRDLLREASEILDQHDPQRDRHRPKLANGERLHLLIGPDVADQHLGVETAVRVGDEGPGHPEDAGITGEGTRGELGKLAVVAGRQVRAKLTNLLLDEMIIVDEPFRRRSYGTPLVDRLDDRAIGLEQNGAVVGEPPRQRLALDRLGRDELRERETSRVLFEALDAEQLLANGFLIFPKRRPPQTFEGAACKSVQFGLSVAR